MTGQAATKLLDKLDKVKPTGANKWLARCPAHDDNNPSLAITSIDGRALVHCFAGCETADVVAALGMRMPDLFDSPKERIYRYDNGRTVRRDYKPDGKKKITQPNTLNPPELYHLAKVRAAAAEGRPIFLVEGEEDVRALESLGVIATTAPMGADSWAKVDYSPLVGSTVLVLADIDKDQTGMKRAAALAEHLPTIGVTLGGVFVAANGLHDAGDHVAAGYTVDDLVEIHPEPLGRGVDMSAEYPDNREQAIAGEVERLRIRAEARRAYDDESREHVELPSVIPLTMFLSEPDTDPDYRLDQIMPTGSNVVLAAQYKAGKSTLVANLTRALVDAEPFLGVFETTRPASRVVLIDNELDARTMRRWLRDQHIAHTDRVDVLPLRGRVGTFDLTDPVIRAQWAQLIGPADVIIFDCLRPVLDALGMDENHDAGRFLVAFDALKAEAGIEEGIIVHHMGHNGERSRGDSRILDWPDVTWRIVRETDDPASPRYFSAFGRDVDVKEGLLTYNADTRALTLTEGSRRDTRGTEALETVTPLVTEYVTTHPGCSGAEIERGIPGGAQLIREARKSLLDIGTIREEPRAGRGGGKGYFPQTSSTSSKPRPDMVRTSSTPVRETGLRFDEENTEPRQPQNDPGYCHGCGGPLPCTKDRPACLALRDND